MSTTTDLTNRVQTATNRLTDQARRLPELRQELLNSRRHNALLRDIGGLHYDAHRNNTPVDQADIDDIIAELDDLHGAPDPVGDNT